MIRPVDTAEVRRSNLALVLGVLDRMGTCSRTDLRQQTGLVSGSVSSIVDELVARGLVIETGETTSQGRGRPRRVLQLRPERVVAVAVQLTAHEIVGEVRDLASTRRWRERRPHAIRRGVAEDIVATIADMLNQTRAAAENLPGTWTADAVVAVPAPVVGGTTIAAAIDFGIGRTELADPLRERLHNRITPTIMNDGRLGALAEYAATEGPTKPHAMAYVTGGAGIGGGLVIGGEPYLGSHLMAGECGHISVDMAGPECACGARGCLTLYLGDEGLLTKAGLAPYAADNGEAAALDELERRLGQRDRDAIASLEQGAAALAAAVGTMSNYTDLDLVVLGGTLPRFAPWLLESVNNLIASRADRIAEFNPAVSLARHGDEATLVGAWRLVRQAVLNDPGRVPILDQ